MSFLAKFRGVCWNCDEWFPVDTEIQWDLRGRTVHAPQCPDPDLTVLDLRPGEKVCPSCHLVHPGEC